MNSLLEDLRKSPVKARIVPFIVFVVLTAAQDWLGEGGRYWCYLAKTVVGGRYDFLFPLETSMNPMFRLLGAPEARTAFDLSREEARLRDRYGRSLFGSSTLLARRLLERGVRFVNVSWDNFRERFRFPPSNQVWDTHARNFPILRDNHLRRRHHFRDRVALWPRRHRRAEERA